MIARIDEKTKLNRRATDQPKEPEKQFRRWYDNNNANDSDIDHQRIQFKPHNLTSMEDTILLASAEDEPKQTRTLPKNTYDGRNLKNAVLPPEHDLHQYQFDFLKSPVLKEKNVWIKSKD